MRVILDIPENNLERLGELAKFQKRSRKAFMELVLINHAECAEDGDPEKFNVFDKGQNKAIATPQIPAALSEQPKEGEKRTLPQKNKPSTNVYNLTNDQNIKTINTERPQRMPDENAFDYAFRINEWKKLQK